MKKLFKIFMVIALTVMMTVTSLPVNTVFADDVPETTETSNEPAGTEEETTVPGEAPADNADVTDGQPADDGTVPAEEPADEEPVVEEEKTVEQPVYEVAEEQGEFTEAPAEEPVTKEPVEEPVVLNAEVFEQEYTVGDLTVKVSYEAGTVPEGTAVVVGEAKPEAVEALKAELGEEVNFAAADISFVWNDKEIEPKDFSDKNVSVTLKYAGEEDLGDTEFETKHVAETVNEDGTVTYEVQEVTSEMTPVTVLVTKTRTVSKYVRTDKVEDGTEEVTEYEKREITEEQIIRYETKTRQVPKTETVKVRVAIKWWDPSTWRGYKYVTRTYYVTEEYQEPVYGPVVVGYEQVPVTKTVTKYKDVDVYEDVEEEYTEEVVVGQTAVFSANEFSSYVISWSTGGWYGEDYSYNIHYVDTEGKSLTPTKTPEFSNGYKFLIYDVDGYVYDSTHYGSRTGAAIKPLLANYGNDRVYLDNNNNWQYLRNDIYVVYKKATEPSSGGTPKVDSDETWPEGNDAPQFSKTSTYNGDGTNTISLSIIGGEKPVEKTTPADVIVVFDVSGSMSESMGNSTRLQRAKTAVNTMANTLLNGANKGVKMALISYSTDAQVVQGFTDNYTTFSGKVNGLSADGGTNWEKGLLLANQMEVRSDAATFVVFVTDGDPTFRVSRGDVSDSNLDLYSDGTYQYYRNNAIFGEGNDDSKGRNFDFAVKQVQSINSKKKEFFAIGISNDVTKVQNLTTQGGVDASHAFIASNAAAMENAFKSITESIKSKLGFGDVEITDGITALSNTEMEVMQTVDPNSFTYYRWGGENNKYGQDEAHKTEWTTREADGCGAASYDKTEGTVNWNMGDSFQLEDGVHYVVTFRVWASQEAYDLVADLNNGVKTYEDLTDAEKAQIVKLDTTPVTYALKTNTDNVNATYKKTTKTGDTVTVSDNTPIDATYTPGTQENLALESMKLTIRKQFEDDLTAGEDRETEVTLVVYRRNAHQDPEEQFVKYPVPQNGTTSENVVLNEANNWTYEFYVAPGVEVNGEVLEHGYDFTIKEPGIDYHYGLVEEIINPMVVDGQDKYYGDGYLINDDETISKYVDQGVTAVNRVKSGIDVKKVVVDKDGKEILPDEEFTIVGKILDANGNPFTWQEGDDVNKSGAYHKYDKEGNRIVYKGHFASTDNIEFTLKAGEYVRFINVPDGCTFEFEEKTSAMPAGYEWKESTGVTQHRVSAGGEFTPEGDVQPTVTDGKVELTTGVVGNKQYSVTFTNTAVNGEYFFVYHSSDNTIEKVFTEDARVKKGTYDETTKTYTYTFDIVAETKEGTLYGGYYHAYAGQKASDAEIPDLTYDDTNWATDTGATPYDAKKANVWKKDQAYTEDPGTAMHPTAGTVYYLKEVPNGYIRPYVHYTYDDYDDAKPIKKFYIITATDDTNYKGAGYVEMPAETQVNAPKKSLSVTIKKPDGTLDKTLSAKNVFDKHGVTRGYLYWGERSDLVGQTSFQYVPCWETLDGVLVKGVTVRTVKNITSHLEIGADDVARGQD